MPRTAVTQPEHEIINTRLYLLAGSPAVDAQNPNTEMTKHVVDPGQNDMSGRPPDHPTHLFDFGDTWIATPAIMANRLAYGNGLAPCPNAGARFIDINHAGERITFAIDHGQAQLGKESTGAVAGAKCELILKMHSGTAIGMVGL